LMSDKMFFTWLLLLKIVGRESDRLECE